MVGGAVEVVAVDVAEPNLKPTPSELEVVVALAAEDAIEVVLMPLNESLLEPNLKPMEFDVVPEVTDDDVVRLEPNLKPTELADGAEF